LTEDFVGDTQVLSNIDSFDNIMRVSEYWWEFGLLDDDVTVRLGKQDVNSEFLLIELAEDFVNSSFGLTPAATLPTYPHPTMGAVLLAQLNDSLQFKAGVWDALAFGGSWGFSGNDTVFAIGELEYSYALLGGKCPGTLAVGGGFLSDGEVSGERLSAAHGYYVQLEQLIYRERTPDESNVQGLGIFAGYYPRFLGSEVLTDSIGDSVVAGIVYRGSFAPARRRCCGRRASLGRGIPRWDESGDRLRVLLQSTDHTPREHSAGSPIHCLTVRHLSRCDCGRSAFPGDVVAASLRHRRGNSGVEWYELSLSSVRIPRNVD
jgi:hypothetical protein